MEANEMQRKQVNYNKEVSYMYPFHYHIFEGVLAR